MLEAIRKYAHNPVFKVIFVLLILAFAISGITGMNFLSDQKDYVAKVGDEKITMHDVESRFEQTLRAMGPQVLQLKPEQLAQLGISRENVLRNLIQGALVRQEAEALGVDVGEASVKKQIAQMPAFQTEGKFDAEKFRVFLEKMNMTERQLTGDMHNDLRNLIIASAVMNNTPKNIFVAEEIAKAIKVTRDVELIKVPAKHIAIKEPTDEELQQFYFENGVNYQAPETRDVSYINIPKPADEDKAGHDRLTKIEDEIAGGSNIQEIGAKAGIQPQKMNNIGLTGVKLNQQAFQLKEGQLSAVSTNEDGSYFVVQVDKIHERTTPELATVKNKVVADWKVKKESDENIRFTQSLVEEIKGGKQLSAVAAEKGLPYEKINGFSSDDKRYGDQFILSVFNAGSGKVTAAVPSSEGGFVVARVVSITQNPVSPAEISQALEQGAQIFQQEAFSQYMSYLEKKHKVVINQQAIQANQQQATQDEDPA